MGTKLNNCITFFEDRNFEACPCEATTDQPDLCAHLNCCNSAKVETGCWIYECPNYVGHQHCLRKGEYPDYQHWMGFNDSIRSCIITAVSFPYCVHIYERNDFRGGLLEFMDNCPSLQGDFYYKDIQSCNILEGSWQYLLRPKVGSFQPTVDTS
uniref:Beta/gamma crystallin 'Greek key' domain-containing protein n=1 Tax=Aquila chrysaetos chrysaetos TaxID=223781 RepID=A0A663DU10_AQUCH